MGSRPYPSPPPPPMSGASVQTDSAEGCPALGLGLSVLASVQPQQLWFPCQSHMDSGAQSETCCHITRSGPSHQTTLWTLLSLEQGLPLVRK